MLLSELHINFACFLLISGFNLNGFSACLLLPNHFPVTTRFNCNGEIYVKILLTLNFTLPPHRFSPQICFNALSSLCIQIAAIVYFLSLILSVQHTSYDSLIT